MRATSQSTGAVRPPLFSATVEPDGTVIPFARYENARWSNDGAGPFDDEPKTWPKPWFWAFFDESRLIHPISTWSALVAPSVTRTIQTGSLVALRAGCE